MTILLGTNGMLGSMLAKTWQGDFKALNRPGFDAEKFTSGLKNATVINAIGVIKPYCDDVERAIRVNALFPHLLPEGTIQIATDCVYSGDRGNYVETDPHNATDTYGKTKSLGEASHIHNLRCSIIGPEIKHHISLLDWFLKQKQVNGFINHWWNGITTYHFSKIVQGAIREDIKLPELQHIVPADKVTKAELLRIIAKAYSKKIIITDTMADTSIDRTLTTLNPQLNQDLWRAAGYESPLTIEDMVNELVAYV